jgi:hypothetical protein
MEIIGNMSLFQNPVGADLRFYGQAPGKTGQTGLMSRPGFSIRTKGAVPKTEVLEQLHIDIYKGIYKIRQIYKRVFSFCYTEFYAYESNILRPKRGVNQWQ